MRFKNLPLTWIISPLFVPAITTPFLLIILASIEVIERSGNTIDANCDASIVPPTPSKHVSSDRGKCDF